MQPAVDSTKKFRKRRTRRKKRKNFIASFCDVVFLKKSRGIIYHTKQKGKDQERVSLASRIVSSILLAEEELSPFSAKHRR